MENVKHSQSGMTLIELMISALIIAIVITTTINVFGLNMSHASISRNQLKASALLKTKMDDLKDYARRASLAGSFMLVTQSATFGTYNLTTNTTRINDLNFTWRIEPLYYYQNGTIETAVGIPISVTAPAKMIRLQGAIFWTDSNQQKALTQTSFVTDITP